jgi:hypothetical protein
MLTEFCTFVEKKITPEFDELLCSIKLVEREFREAFCLDQDESLKDFLDSLIKFNQEHEKRIRELKRKRLIKVKPTGVRSQRSSPRVSPIVTRRGEMGITRTVSKPSRMSPQNSRIGQGV